MRKLLTLTLISLGALTAIGAFAQTNIAIVDEALVYQKCLLGQKKEAELKTAYNKKKTDLEARKKALDALRQQANDPKISQEKKDAIQSKFNQKVYEVQAMTKAAQDSMQDMARKSQADFQKKLAVVISQYAHAKGFSLVLEKMGCLYNADALDITQEIIAAMNQAYPGK